MKLKERIERGWRKILEDDFHAPYMADLEEFLAEEFKKHTIYPPIHDIFNAFKYTPFHQVKVVVLGQDPYHGPGQAHGLCFSVQKGTPAPPSLVNIFKEIHDDLGAPIPDNGCLEPWARQGVFLLNTALTVRARQAHSHARKGWETFTDRVIDELNRKRDNLVFLLWGGPAGKKADQIDDARHLILKAPHPSPLSAYRGFPGCRHFSRTNAYLKEKGIEPIHWSIPDIPDMQHPLPLSF
ncbi:MAG: uracil-DNA glycosylase [Desulfobacterales bacterium]|nr:uracil-DNA glycosylase [Desulfobacterales bacterium]